MNKKVLSFIVILCTILTVAIMLFSTNSNVKQQPTGGKIEVINSVNSSSNSKEIKESNEATKGNIYRKKQDDEKINSYVSTDKYKQFKLDEANQKAQQDKNNFFPQNNSGKNSESATSSKNATNKYTQNYTKNSGEMNNKEFNEGQNSSNNSGNDGVPVFKISRYKVKDSLTFADKEKLLLIASKLSPVDYEKINKYLQVGSDEDIKNTLKLLKERLSDKDYGKVKEVAEKFINMDAIGQ